MILFIFLGCLPIVPNNQVFLTHPTYTASANNFHKVSGTRPNNYQSCNKKQLQDVILNMTSGPSETFSHKPKCLGKASWILMNRVN